METHGTPALRAGNSKSGGVGKESEWEGAAALLVGGDSVDVAAGVEGLLEVLDCMIGQVLVLRLLLLLVDGRSWENGEAWPPSKGRPAMRERKRERAKEEERRRGREKRGTIWALVSLMWGLVLFCFCSCFDWIWSGVLCFRFKLGFHPETRQWQRGTLLVHPLRIGGRR